MIRCKKTQKLKCSFPDACPHTWHSSHPYMACTWHVSSCLAFQPPIHALHLTCIPMPGISATHTCHAPGMHPHTWLVPSTCPHTWHSSHPYMPCTWPPSSCLGYTWPLQNQGL